MTPPIDDEALMLAFAGGDAAAFDVLYARHKGGVYRYFLRSLRQPALAEELLQDVWLSVVDRRGHYRPEARFATYLYTIAHNRLIDHVRRADKIVFLSFRQGDGEEDVPALDPPAPDCADPARQVEARSQAAAFLRALEALPLAQREAFLLQQEADMSVEAIAQATGTGVETAKSRLRYAMTKLRAAMEAWR